MLTTLNLPIVMGLAVAILVSVATGFEQLCVLYNTDYCNLTNCEDGPCPPNENITFTTSQPVIPPPWDNHSLSLQEYGVWVLGVFNGTHERRLPPGNIRWLDKTCWNNFEDAFGSEMTFTYVERIGPPDTTTVQLLLYSGEVFTETSEIIEDDQQIVNFGSVKSYVFFGNAAWLIYPLPSYEGIPQCFRHPNPDSTLNAIAMTLITKVGSVRKTTWEECWSTVTTTTTTSTTSTTTTTTAKTDTTTRTTTSSEPTGTSSKGPGGGDGSGALIMPNIITSFLSTLSVFIIKLKYF